MNRDWPLIHPSMFWSPWTSWRDLGIGLDDWDTSDQDVATQEQSTPSSMTVDTQRQRHPAQRSSGGNQGLRSWTHHQAGIVKTEKKPTGELVIKTQLPGVNRDDVHLDLKDEDNESVLTLSVEKKEDHHTTDRFGGSFNRSSFFKIVRAIPLGAKVSVDEVKADLADECLVVEVKLPQSGQKEKTSRIDIHSSSSRKGVSGSQSQSQQQQQQQQPQQQQGKVQQHRAGKGEAMDTDIQTEQQ